MICNNCNNSITKQDAICPNCQSKTGINTIGLLNAGIVLSALGLILGFGPTLYWFMLMSGVMYTPLSYESGFDLFFQGVFITIIGIICGIVGLIMFSIGIGQKRYRKAR